nr:hypothetical protein [Spongiactinospora rosea]
MGVWRYLSLHEPLLRAVGQPQSDLRVQLRLVGRVGLLQDLHQVTDGRHHRVNLFRSHPPPCTDLPELRLNRRPLGLYLGDPPCDQRGVGPGLQGGTVRGQLAVTFDDPPAQRLIGGAGRTVLAGGGQFMCRLRDPFLAECGGQPGVQRGQHVGLAQVHGLGVIDVVGQGVLGRVAAPVVALPVVVVALHPPLAVPAEQHPAQQVRPAGAVRLVRGRAPASAGENGLGLLELLRGDQRLMRDLRRPHPAVAVVPPLPGHVPHRDIVDVDQHLVLALLVPHLPPGVPRVDDDRPDRALGPRRPLPMPVAGPVMRRRARHPVAGQPFGDRVDPPARAELAEDPPYHLGRRRVRRQATQPLAVGGLGRVGVRPQVHQVVPVRRAPAQEAALGLGEGGHRGPHPDLDPVAFAFADPAEHRHDQFVGLVGRVDRPAHLRHPQRHSVVLEQREGQPELVAVERPLRLADHHRLEPA